MRISSKPWVKVLALLVVAGVMMPSFSALAESYDPDQMITPPTGFEKRLTKLGRGVSNILFGWAELPVTFDEKLKEGKPLAYLLGVVPVLGTTRAVLRTGTGVFEIFTFPVSDLEVNFEPILEPEYIF
ncbi:MAG TPA: exosortase system-associated protein, TIGR04073 family [Candidatus Hydrogenedentes bacterium]|nr:exosortase system-associated protein, TIGR04073 family [Candidatus Hydrogenedentota bacterium]